MGFGEAISKQFVDALETGQDARAAMNLHNNEAGRKVSPSFPPELTVHTKLALNIHCGESQFAVAKITEETASGGRQQLYNGVRSKVAKLLCYSVNDFLQSSFSQFTVGGSTVEKQICELQDYCVGRIDTKLLHRPGAMFLHALQYRAAPPGFFS